MNDKPTIRIDEQIARQRWVMGEYTGADIDVAILSTLRAHKAIMEAKRPKPVAWYDRMTLEVHFGKSVPAHIGDGDWVPLYGPDLLDYADRMAAERDYNGAEWAKSAEALVIQVNRAETALSAPQPADGVVVPNYKELYYDLIMQVGNAYPDESRHDTAKRYIINAETQNPNQVAAAKEQT